jgi:hypothetical protein
MAFHHWLLFALQTGAEADLPVNVPPVVGQTRLAACPLPLPWLTLPKQSRFTLWFESGRNRH